MKLPNNLYVELYAEMAAAILNEHHDEELHFTAENGDVRYTDEAQELFEEYSSLVFRVLDMVGITDGAEDTPPPLKKGQFSVQIGRGATVFHSATVEASSLDAAKDRLSKRGYDCPDDTVWVEDGHDGPCSDNVEVAYITSPDGTVSSWDDEGEWEEEQ